MERTPCNSFLSTRFYNDIHPDGDTIHDPDHIRERKQLGIKGMKKVMSHSEVWQLMGEKRAAKRCASRGERFSPLQLLPAVSASKKGSETSKCTSRIGPE
jgi:hypothetical protein